MELSDYLSRRGAQALLAAAVGCQPQLMWQWAKKVRRVPAERCPAIEHATRGQVTCEELRPDVRWQRFPDGTWPHPSGRPLEDHAAAIAAAAYRAAA
jgi:DNA-binding transcriptional regulator YdaS (Cro superfamily)